MLYDNMNILYVFNDLGFGGAGQSLIDTLVEMSDKVNPIVIIRDDANTDVRKKLDEMGILYYSISFTNDFVKMGYARDLDRQLYLKQSYEAAIKLFSIIIKNNIQLVHINSSVSYFAAIASLMADIPYVWHIRELIDEHYGCESLNEELKHYLYSLSDRIIVISDYVKQQYQNKHNIQSLRIYNGLDVKKYERDIDENTDFRNVFLVAALITPEKGQWDAVRATELLVQRGYSDVKVIIVGSTGTNYVWALKKYIKKKKLNKNISVLPFQSDLSWLREKASYSITCSQSEALGRVTIEAMLAGNLVIGARSGGTIEIIGKNQERGFLYELHNSNDLADVMERVINYPRYKKIEIISKAHAYAKNIFDSKEYCKYLLKMYKDVIFSFVSKKQKPFLNDLEREYKVVKNINIQEQYKLDKQYKKSEKIVKLMTKWLEIKQNGHALDEYFKKNNIWSIAIYGMSNLGCRLYDELEEGEIEVKYLLDKNPNGMDSIFEFVSLEKNEIEVDAIVVTVAGEEKQIVKKIKSIGFSCVVGLSDILDSFQDTI